MSNTATTAPTGSKTDAFKEMQREAQEETLADLAQTRVKLHRLRTQLAGLQGEEVYTEALLEVVKSWADQGISTSSLHDEFPDGKKLSQARNTLVAEGIINQEKKGNAWLLKVTKPSAGDPAQEPPAKSPKTKKEVPEPAAA